MIGIFHTCYIGRWNSGSNVDSAGQQFRYTGRSFRNGAEYHFIPFWGSLEIILVFHQLYTVILGPFAELVRTGPNWLFQEGINSVLFNILGRQDACAHLRQTVQEQRVRPIGNNIGGQVIGHFYFNNVFTI
ncbi:hypothetical protein D3C75_901320 [compost metagenome]